MFLNLHCFMDQSSSLKVQISPLFITTNYFQAQVERMKARAQIKMQEKLAETRQLVEEKQAVAEARRNREAARTARQVEQIRQTGHIPSRFRCCSWLL